MSNGILQSVSNGLPLELEYWQRRDVGLDPRVVGQQFLSGDSQPTSSFDEEFACLLSVI